MKKELAVLGMNETHRAAWLRAGPITWFAFGSVWTGMIVWRLITGDTPWFLIAMVPVFAMTRLGLCAYCRR